jgi:hypothetical protein
MKKLFALVITMLLGASMSFAQATGGSTDAKAPAKAKTAESGKKGTKATKAKKGQKAGKKGKKSGSSTPTTPPPK